jgi:hypothetical protein
VFFIAVLPISVQGLGTTQAAMVYFFARYGPGDAEQQKAAVIGASIFGQAISTVFQLILGIACLRSRVGRELQAAAASARQAPADAPPA